MKKLEDYTNEELSLLTELEVENLIDIECMRAGVPLSITPKPVLKEVPKIEDPTNVIYTVDSYSLTDKNEADQLVTLLAAIESRVTTDYDYNVSGSNYKYYKKYNNPVDVKKTTCYSKEEYNELADIIKSRKTIEEYNKNILKEYNEFTSERREVVNTVIEAIDDAKQEMRKINEALNIYKKYVELSDGDVEIANKFFEQNSKVSEYKDEVLNRYSANKIA